jgi:2,3-bisphosphoglycerate-independent phosphoglycerate mutase
MAIRPKPLLLLILDGFGISKERDHNAIALAATPCWDSLQQDYPMTALNCSGDVVGLPCDQMGNSEVGHLHIGSGRLLRQELTRVSYNRDRTNKGTIRVKNVKGMEKSKKKRR